MRAVNRAANRPAEQIKIAENIENLMAREFVGETQFGVDDLFVVDEDEITQPSAVGQTHGLQLGDVCEKAEGPRRCDFARETLRRRDDDRYIACSPTGSG